MRPDHRSRDPASVGIEALGQLLRMTQRGGMTAIDLIRGDAKALRCDAPTPPPLPPGADPYIIEHWNELSNADCDAAFEFGLDVLIAGLERVRSGEAGKPS